MVYEYNDGRYESDGLNGTPSQDFVDYIIANVGNEVCIQIEGEIGT
jgi:hypothetical protein